MGNWEELKQWVQDTAQNEATYLANARTKTDDVALVMIDDALKGL